MKKEDHHNYKGWLNSDFFFKRALAVVGHNFVGVLMIYGIILLAMLPFMLIFGLYN